MGLGFWVDDRQGRGGCLGAGDVCAAPGRSRFVKFPGTVIQHDPLAEPGVLFGWGRFGDRHVAHRRGRHRGGGSMCLMGDGAVSSFTDSIEAGDRRPGTVIVGGTWVRERGKR